MRLRALLDHGALGLRLLTGERLLDAAIRGVMTTDLRDPRRYLHGGELVLTGLAWWRGPADAEPFVRALVDAGVAGLAAGEAEFGPAPDELVAACARHRLPLFAVAEEVSFAEITEHVVRRVSGERAGDLAAVVDRHRRLMSAGPAGGGPRAVLDLLAADLDLHAWLLSSVGRPIAASGGVALPPGLGPRLAGRHQAAAREGRAGPHRVVLDSTVYALFPVGGGEAGGARGTALSDWVLAVRADIREWPAERRELLDGVAALIAAERDRRDASRTVQRRLAQEVLELIRRGAPAAEVAARLRVAAPVLVPGRPDPHWQVVAGRLDFADAERDGGPVARTLLEELLADPAAPELGVAVAHEAGEAVALVPLPVLPDGDGELDADGADGGDGGDGADGGDGGDVRGGSAGGARRAGGSARPAPEGARAGGPCRPGVSPDGRSPLRATSVLAPARDVLARGLGSDGRFTLGMSAAVASADGLAGALAEARHCRRVAAAGPGPVAGAGHEDLASHVLLLPFVPEDAREAFTARLLEPLRAYDRRHRTELVATLESFLAADGSWTRCAARLHVHVNTLRYRIGRIEQLTGRELTRLEDKVDFLLALRMA